MRVIFSEKGQNIWKFGGKCTKFENIPKKGSLKHHTHETARICTGLPNLETKILLRFYIHIILYKHRNDCDLQFNILPVSTKLNTSLVLFKSYLSIL